MTSTERWNRGDAPPRCSSTSHTRRWTTSATVGIALVGIGKASAEMALCLENILGNRITAGIAVTKEGHSSQTKIVKVIEASHPYPDERSLTAGNEILSLCKRADKNDLVINLISGGGSVLAEVLKEKIKLAEWIELNKFLINSGADISEINSIRQKISKIKNGGLLCFIYPAESISLIISDVIGDKLEFIASGPTFYKQTNINTIHEIINKYQIDKHFSKDILDYLIEDTVNEKPQNSVKNLKSDLKRDCIPYYKYDELVLKIEDYKKKI